MHVCVEDGFGHVPMAICLPGRRIQFENESNRRAEKQNRVKEDKCEERRHRQKSREEDREGKMEIQNRRRQRVGSVAHIFVDGHV